MFSDYALTLLARVAVEERLRDSQRARLVREALRARQAEREVARPMPGPNRSWVWVPGWQRLVVARRRSL